MYAFRSRRKVLKLTFYVFIFFGLPVIFAGKTFAIEYGGLGGKPANPDPSNPRTKSIFVYTAEPGRVLNDGVLVINNTAETKTVYVYATDSQKSSDGAFACEQFSDPKDGVGSWIKLEKDEITLESGTSEVVNFELTVPENASVGEENGCVLVQEKKENVEGASGVTLSLRTGLRVAITIPGQQIRDLDFKSFIVAHCKGSDYKEKEEREDGYVPTEKDNLSKCSKDFTKAQVNIENKGNVSVDTKVRLRMDYLFGFKHYSNEENDKSNDEDSSAGVDYPSYPALRGEVLTLNFEIPKPYWGGIMKVYADAEYDSSDSAGVGIETENKKTILKSGTKYIFIMPQLTALLIELAVLGLIICALVYFVKRSKEGKKVKQSWVIYTVTLGDDINKVAKSHNVSWKKLAKANKLKAPYLLTSGQRLKVPPK